MEGTTRRTPASRDFGIAEVPGLGVGLLAHLLSATPKSLLTDRAKRGDMNEQALMQRAVELSLLGRGLTYPNPIVGAVIVNNSGEILAQGFHQGREHAEVLALRELQESGDTHQELTLIVTLEPCNHHGKTPPCTEAIMDLGVRSGITRVTYATADPNPIAEGGAERLRASGLEVTQFDSPEARFANRDWLTKMRLGRPRITWKVATSLDGAIAAQDGTSKWITNEVSRVDVKRERSLSDAIVTGTGTVLADDPSMLGDGKNPVRIVMGNRSVPKDKKISSADAETIVMQSRRSDDLLALARERGFNRLFLECGPTLGSALFQEGLVDELLIYQAPTIVGSDRRFTTGINLSSIDQQIRLRSEVVEDLDGDIKRLLFLDNAMNKEFSCSPA